MLVRLAKLKTKIHKPLFKLFEQPRTCGKATNEKCELLMISQERCYGRQRIRTELPGMRRLKLSLIESTVD